MSSNKKYIYTAALTAMAVTIAVIAWPSAARSSQLRSCGTIESLNMKIECIFRLIETAYMEDGISEAMRIFADAYVHFPDFASSGCHKYAHRMGDLAYYYGYAQTQDLDSLDFPAETTACGYGFYHGFFEHLIQDHPTADFVNETCEYMRERLSGIMPHIGMTCYHGSGHGLTLAESEIQSKAAWGDMRAFAKHPVEICESMPNATDFDKDECKEGVFNIIVEWMALEQFGFSYDLEKPFRPCNRLGGVYVKPCYFEMAQKLDGFSGQDPVRMMEILADAPAKLKQRSFETGIAGVMQQRIADEDPYGALLDRCAHISDPAYLVCLRSVINGMFEHGEPRREYEKVLDLCAGDNIADPHKEACYGYMSDRLRRFYEAEEIKAICSRVPKSYRDACLDPRSAPEPSL